MINQVAASILDRQGGGASIVYAVATGTNTVQVMGAATAVELPAVQPVYDGDYCAVLVQGADRLILGPIPAVTDWSGALTTADGNWTASYSLRWRREGDRVCLSGWAYRTSSSFTAPSNLLSFSTNSMPTPARNQTMMGQAILSSTSYPILWVADAGTGYIRTATGTYDIGVNDYIYLDGLSYYIT